ncbi:MAG TPA: hypothetical protein VFN35_19950 [Ktedonobacteraceae bacterium]|nr:hypothetical protein [Ktedonobacteraceae bacterium]
MGSSPENIARLQRVRCGQCRFPLVQWYQGDVSYTPEQPGEPSQAQPLPAYSYRTLTDPTPLRSCPQCGAILSPTMVTVVQPETRLREERTLLPPETFW